MLKLSCIVCICLLSLPVFCKSVSSYQVATITDVQPHHAADGDDQGVPSYDVSLKVGGTVYVVLYKSPSGANTVKYAAGRDLLVLVGEKAIRYNDILGESHDVPIVSQKPAADSKKSNAQ